MNNETTPHGNSAADGTIPAAAGLPATTSPASSETTLEVAPDEAPKPTSWDDLGVHPDVKLALDEMGYFLPTAVQATVYKPVSENKDLLVQSRTGTGKTSAFGLPIVSRIIPAAREPQAMILCPTRELALQVARELTRLSAHRGIVVEALYGGAPIGKQITALKDGVHIVVGTPGRVLDHIGRRTLVTKNITTFVLDECDEMLSMGFLEDIERVVSTLPEKRQTLLFSATMPDEVTRYSRRHMKAPEQISLSRDQVSVDAIHHAYYIVSGLARGRDLLKILFAENPDSAIIFCNTRGETTSVAKFLQKQGLDAEPLSSDLSQADRERVMGRMKAGNLRFLCATDVAARGIDISNLSHVINYSVPESPEVYVHRTGRTGRAGKKGTALSLVGPRELGNFRYVRLTFNIKPEERVLPKDDIFEGKLKVPLPPVGAPQAPDPIQILIRGVQIAANGPSDLERQIFEKLLVSQKGKAVLTQLVADRLNQVTTRSKPRRARSEGHGHDAQAEGGAAGAPAEGFGERPRFGEDRPRREGGEDRPRRFDGERGERGDRPRFGEDRPRREGGEDRPRREGGEDRPRRFDGGEGAGGGGERGERPRFGEDRPRRDGAESGGGERGTRRYGEDREGRPRFGGGAEGGERGDRPRRDGEDRPRRFDGERGRSGDRERGRFGDRDRPRRDEQPADAVASAQDATAPVDGALAATSTTTTAATATMEHEPRTERTERVEAVSTEDGGERAARGDRERTDRGDRGDRDRGGRDRGRGRDRDRGGRDRDRDVTAQAHASEAAPSTAPEAAAPLAAPTAASEPARSPDRTESGRTESEPARSPGRTESGRTESGKGKRKTGATSDTREFWETWAEEKSTRVDEPAAAAEPVSAAAEPASEAGDESTGKRERGGRGRSRERSSERTGDRDAKKPDAKAERPERGSRAKRDTTVDTGAAAMPSNGRGRGTDAPSAPAAAGETAQARLFVNLGKKHGVSADDLRSLLAGPVGGDTARIGSVSLRDSHAHVRVPEELVEAIIGGVHGTSHADQSVTVERARA